MTSRTRSISLAFTTLLMAASTTWAQTDKALRVIVGFPAGAAVDVVTRIVTEKMQDSLKRPIIVDNRPGAGGRLAAELLKAAAPDGNTVMITPIVVPVLAPLVFSKLNYKPETDFAPVGKICDFGFALAVPVSAPAKNLKEYATWLKANPQQANFGSPAAGSLPHFFGVMIGAALKVEMVHVPFNGGAALQSAVLGGHAPAGIDVVMEWQQNAKAGKVNVLATSGEQRSRVLPDVPTFKELGFPDVVGQGWFAMYAPAKTPAPVITRLNQEIVRFLNTAQAKERFLSVGGEVAASSPEQCAAILKAEMTRWSKVIKDTGFKIE